MTQEPLEKRLREKVPVARPPHGLETRIQALARASRTPQTTNHLPRLLLPVLATLTFSAIVLTPSLMPRDEPAIQAPTASKSTPAPLLWQIQEPVRREYEGLKNDARRTMSLFRNTVPSIPVSTKKTKQ